LLEGAAALDLDNELIFGSAAILEAAELADAPDAEELAGPQLDGVAARAVRSAAMLPVDNLWK